MEHQKRPKKLSRMRVVIRSAALSIFTLLLFDAPGTAQQVTTPISPDPIVGSWKLNLEKSKYETPPPMSQTVTIAPAGRGYSFTIDMVAADGRPQKWGYLSAFDGAEVPVTGAPGIDTVVATTQNVRYKRAGVVITSTTSQVSDDGKTLVVTAKLPFGGKEFTNVSVYEKQ